LSKLETEIETTPMQEKLEKIGTDIGTLGVFAATITVHTLFFRFFIERFVSRSMDLFGGGEDTGDFLMMGGAIKAYCSEWIRYFILGIAIIVVSVPEGLPLAVMISLAYSVRKML
jgi:magnesium-transporting ATPase (P-type)